MLILNTSVVSFFALNLGYLNTLYVDIKHDPFLHHLFLSTDLNTLYVDIKHTIPTINIPGNAFKYIIC